MAHQVQLVRQVAMVEMVQMVFLAQPDQQVPAAAAAAAAAAEGLVSSLLFQSLSTHLIAMVSVEQRLLASMARPTLSATAPLVLTHTASVSPMEQLRLVTANLLPKQSRSRWIALLMVKNLDSPHLTLEISLTSVPVSVLAST